MSVGYHDAGVDREALAAHDAFLHAARHHRLEQLAQEIALAETAVAVLGKRRMIRDVAIEPQATGVCGKRVVSKLRPSKIALATSNNFKVALQKYQCLLLNRELAPTYLSEAIASN